MAAYKPIANGSNGPSLLVAVASEGQNAATDLMAVESPKWRKLRSVRMAASVTFAKNVTKSDTVHPWVCGSHFFVRDH
jgi:hypothetical protein